VEKSSLKKANSNLSFRRGEEKEENQREVH
jgi:hypothetical protein